MCLQVVTALICGCALRGQAGETQAVLLYNQAEVPAETLAEARAWTSRIMRDSGISLVWPNCSVRPREGSSDCQAYYDREPLIVQLLADGGAFQDKTTLAWSSVGVRGNQRSVVFIDRVRKFMTGTAPPFGLGRMLGYVIAHEMGHLLLAQVGHSSRGIMSKCWGVEQFTLISRGELLFDYSQSKRMADEVRRRTALLPAIVVQSVE